MTEKEYFGIGLFLALGLILWALDGIAMHLGYESFFGLFFLVCLMFLWSAMLAFREYMEVVNNE